MPAKPDYGIDAPGVIRNLLVIGAALVGAGFFMPVVRIGTVRFALGRMLLFTGILLMFEGVAMIAYAKFGKYRHRDRMLNKITWRGDERVLDVGTGRGVMLIGAAKRVPQGSAIGIDIWAAKDLSGNSMEATFRNAEMEGVRKRVELKTEDASQMQFPDASFDVVVSNLCLHNIEDSTARRKACAEIARVLKPNGMAVISDFKHTGEYAAEFSRFGLKVERSGPYLVDTFPPLRIVAARKPA